MMVEAGGRAVRFNGGPFQPEGPLDGGIISGLTAEAVAAAGDVLEMVELPLLRR
jgi:hypothetical protein